MSHTSRLNDPERGQSSLDNDTRISEAKQLIKGQRTMVLATCGSGCAAWAAPVYFVYCDGAFWFFSSPRSRHILQAGSSTVAAAIYADTGEWEQIVGIQMSGRIKPVAKQVTRIVIMGRYFLKFPFARAFFSRADSKAAGNDPPDLAGRVELYKFIPIAMEYTNNRLGFGRSWPIDPI